MVLCTIEDAYFDYKDGELLAKKSDKIEWTRKQDTLSFQRSVCGRAGKINPDHKRSNKWIMAWWDKTNRSFLPGTEKPR